MLAQLKDALRNRHIWQCRSTQLYAQQVDAQLLQLTAYEKVLKRGAIVYADDRISEFFIDFDPLLLELLQSHGIHTIGQLIAMPAGATRIATDTQTRLHEKVTALQLSTEDKQEIIEYLAMFGIRVHMRR